MHQLIKNKFKGQVAVFSDVVINKKRIYEEVADQIEKRIVAGQLGDKLPSERSLAKQFGVSVPTIQKALVVLSTTGYIKIVHGGGAYITSKDLSSPEIFFQLTEVRKIFECQVVGLSAVRRTDRDLSLLKIFL